MDIDLGERLFQFAVRIVRFMRNLPDEPEFNNIRFQISKSSSSSGANYEEARESNYWLRLLEATLEFGNESKNELSWLLKESVELKNILGKIAASARNNMQNGL